MANVLTKIATVDPSTHYLSAQIDTSDAVDIFPTGITQFSCVVENPTAQGVHLKTYNKAASSVNPASDTPREKYYVPANSTRVLYDGTSLITHGTQMSVRCVQGAGDTDTTAPSSAVTVYFIGRS